MALIMDDPDAATDPDGPGQPFVHWVVFNIPADTNVVAEGSLPVGATAGLNGAGKPGYIDPAPPNGEHRYFFRIYALNGTLDLDESATAGEVKQAIKPMLLGEASLIGRYAKVTAS